MSCRSASSHTLASRDTKPRTQTHTFTIMLERLANSMRGECANYALSGWWMRSIINMTSFQLVEMKTSQQNFSYYVSLTFFFLSIIQGQVWLKHYLALSNECAVFESVDMCCYAGHWGLWETHQSLNFTSKWRLAQSLWRLSAPLSHS